MNVKSLSQFVTYKQQDMSMIGIKKADGMDSYNKLYSFAYRCVVSHASYDRLDGFYSLSVSYLPDFTKHEFAALIMNYCEGYASEAIGPDNKHWDSKMLPALTRYLSHTSDQDEEIEFTQVWRNCVTDYMTSKMQELVDEALIEYNQEMGCNKDSLQLYGVAARG